VLFLNGVDDPAFPVSAAELAAQVPGHLSIVERPAAVAGQLIDFIRRQPRP
jgi:hypothetical protein